MHISNKALFELVANGLVVIVFLFLGYIFLIKKQNSKLNWAIFYAILYGSISLPIVNALCIRFDFWHFYLNKDSVIGIPFDLYLIWLVLWNIAPVYFFKGKHLLILSVFLFWMDILTMPFLEKFGVLKLNKNWLLGEAMLIIFVFIPAYYWAFISFFDKQTKIRATFQVLVISGFTLIGFPKLLISYGLIENNPFYWSPYLLQFLIILTFPAL
jgi:hypothetical protein